MKQWAASRLLGREKLLRWTPRETGVSPGQSEEPLWMQLGWKNETPFCICRPRQCPCHNACGSPAPRHPNNEGTIFQASTTTGFQWFCCVPSATAFKLGPAGYTQTHLSVSEKHIKARHSPCAHKGATSWMRVHFSHENKASGRLPLHHHRENRLLLWLSSKCINYHS